MEWLLLWPASIIFSTGYLFKAGTEFLNDIYESGYKINKKSDINSNCAPSKG